MSGPTLVADIGGTNTRVALTEGGAVDPGTVRRFRNADHASLDAVLDAYLDAAGRPDCTGACVAMAGPVHDGHGTLTNLDWVVDRDTVARAAQAEVTAVLNDLQAQGHALDAVDPGAVVSLIDGTDPEAGGRRLVVGIGTGVNSVTVHETPGGRFIPPAESGHVAMPVRTEADLRLAAHVTADHGFASAEDVLAGRGLARIHRWLSDEAGRPARLDPAEVTARIGDDPLATEAAAVWARLLGCYVGDLALHALPFGGIVLVGGVARSMRPHLGDGFARALHDKGRFSDLVRRFPVSMIEDDYAALTGCAAHLAELMG